MDNVQKIADALEIEPYLLFVEELEKKKGSNSYLTLFLYNEEVEWRVSFRVETSAIKTVNYFFIIHIRLSRLGKTSVSQVKKSVMVQVETTK